METAAELISKISSFINAAGIECRPGRLTHATFLPAIDIQNGCIIYDPEQLKHPGDLLHEAGHLAVLRPQYRIMAQSGDSISGDMAAPAAEMAAIAWSWAAAAYLNMAPEILFHEEGYKGGGGHVDPQLHSRAIYRCSYSAMDRHD